MREITLTFSGSFCGQWFSFKFKFREQSWLNYLGAFLPNLSIIDTYSSDPKHPYSSISFYQNFGENIITFIMLYKNAFNDFKKDTSDHFLIRLKKRGRIPITHNLTVGFFVYLKSWNFGKKCFSQSSALNYNFRVTKSSEISQSLKIIFFVKISLCTKMLRQFKVSNHTVWTIQYLESSSKFEMILVTKIN